MVLFMVFFFSPLSPLLCFLFTMFVIIYVSLLSFTDDVEGPHADRTYVCNLELHQN